MININIIGDQICGSYGSTSFSIKHDKELLKKLTKIQDSVNSADSMDKVKELLEKFSKLLVVDTTSLVEDKCKGIKFNPATEKYYLEYNKVLSTVAIPQVLMDKIHLAIDKGLSTEPIVKFWIRLLRNPNIHTSEEAEIFAQDVCNYISKTIVSDVLYDQFIEAGYSEDKAEEMAEVFQTPLTMEGLINTKKVVTPITDSNPYHYSLDENGNAVKTLKTSYKDRQVIDSDTGKIIVEEPKFNEDWLFQPKIMGTSGDEFYCGDKLGHVVKVGFEHYLPNWSQVDCNSNHSCVKGLHQGGHDYIHGMENDSTVTLNMFTCPSQIGAISYNDGYDVMRSKSYFVHSIKDRETDNKSLYHSSTYAAKLDADWENDKKEIIEKFNKELVEAKAYIAQISSL